MDGGGCLMNQGVHTVDLLRWLAGPVTSVYAQARTAAHVRLEVEDMITATLTFATAAIGTLMASTAAYPGFPARLALHGTRGSAVIEGDALQTLAIQGREPLQVRPPSRTPFKWRPGAPGPRRQVGSATAAAPTRPPSGATPTAPSWPISSTAAAPAKRREWTGRRADGPWSWCWPPTSRRGRGSGDARRAGT